jgi:hypothetical protein
MPGQPAAFVSYVRFNDQHDDGWISQFCKLLSAEVRVQIGEEFPIFQDRKDIAWGQSWQQRIDQALDSVTLLLVIITPGFFRSSACRDEVERFLARERELDREDLILPVYYVSTPELDDPERSDADELARVLRSRQFADWRDLRFEPLTSPEARRAVAELAGRMRDTFWRSAGTSSNGPRKPTRRVVKPSPPGETAPETGISAKTNVRAHMADPLVAGGGGGSDNVIPLGPRVRSKRDQLAELMWQARQDLYKLVQRIGQYDDASEAVVSYLDEGGHILRALLERVEAVRDDIDEETGRGSELTLLLRQLSGSIRVARDAINDFRATLRVELVQRAAEVEHHDHRSNKRFREDQQELRALSRAAEGELSELRKSMEFFLNEFDAARPQSTRPP